MNPYRAGDRVRGRDCGGRRFEGVVTGTTLYGVVLDGTHFTPLSLVEGALPSSGEGKRLHRSLGGRKSDTADKATRKAKTKGQLDLF